MCDTRDFHAALSRLAYGHAENTIAYIQDEARRIDEKCKAEQWRDCGEQMTVADKTLLEDMMCDPAAGRCVIRSDGTVLNINERMAGWIGIGVVIVLMYIYQTHFGSLYLHIGIVSSLFMVGLTSGAVIISYVLKRTSNLVSRFRYYPSILVVAILFHTFILSAR